MNMNESTPRKPLRLWPGIVLAILVVLVRFGAPIFPDGILVAILGSVVGGVLILLWWMFFSRAPWLERLGAVALMVVAVFGTRYVVDESIRGGMMGRMLPMLLALPAMPVVLVAWAVATRRLAAGPRRAALVAAILLVCGAFSIIRTDGVLGGGSQITWRWTPTAEEKLLAQAASEPLPVTPAVAAPAPAAPPEPTPAVTADVPAPPSDPAATKAPEEKTAPPATAAADVAVRWVGFRGPARDGIIRGVRIETDWATSPPVAVWRRPIGPGWSSFAVAGDFLYTQEQRGEDEVVACYRVSTGTPVWMHKDRVRFYESNGGAGPRGTPTFSNGRVYTLGATGIVNALDAGTGAVVWSRNAGTDTGAALPGWGFASSPIVVGDVVIVAASGRLAGYEVAGGRPRWTIQTGGGGYSSPHLLTIDGVAQVVLLSSAGAASVAPADGALLWKHSFETGVAMLQPAVAGDGDILIAGGDSMGGVGMRRVAIAHGSAGWTAEERWTSRGLKPYFSDFVVHEGHAFGFDGSILSCIDVTDGTRKWKGGRYGSGQLVLLADQDLLLVTSEEGELALVGATPDRFTELAPKLPAIEGKTWNHPVVIGDLLLIRNGQEMAAFRLPLAPETRGGLEPLR
jgi:outer membrane protein assembly factor BamB